MTDKKTPAEIAAYKIIMEEVDYSDDESMKELLAKATSIINEALTGERAERALRIKFDQKLSEVENVRYDNLETKLETTLERHDRMAAFIDWLQKYCVTGEAQIINCPSIDFARFDLGPNKTTLHNFLTEAAERHEKK